MHSKVKIELVPYFFNIKKKIIWFCDFVEFSVREKMNPREASVVDLGQKS